MGFPGAPCRACRGFYIGDALSAQPQMYKQRFPSLSPLKNEKSRQRTPEKLIPKLFSIADTDEKRCLYMKVASVPSFKKYQELFSIAVTEEKRYIYTKTAST